MLGRRRLHRASLTQQPVRIPRGDASRTQQLWECMHGRVPNCPPHRRFAIAESAACLDSKSSWKKLMRPPADIFSSSPLENRMSLMTAQKKARNFLTRGACEQVGGRPPFQRWRRLVVVAADDRGHLCHLPCRLRPQLFRISIDRPRFAMAGERDRKKRVDFIFMPSCHGWIILCYVMTVGCVRAAGRWARG